MTEDVSYWDKRGFSEHVGSMSSSAAFWILFVVSIILFFLDARTAFNRSGGALVRWFSLWAFFGLFVYFLTERESMWDPGVFRQVVVRTLLAVFLPYLFQQGSVLVQTFSLGSFADGVLRVILEVLTPILGSFIAWPALFLEEAAQHNRFFSIINVAIYLLIAANVLSGLILAADADPLLQRGLPGQQGEPVTFVDLYTGAWDTIKETTGTIKAGVAGEVDSRVGNATQAHYTGTVERQQGRLLGVSIKNQQSIKPYYSFVQEDGEYVLGPDRQAVWFGTVEARTFAENLQVDLSCAYAYANGTVRYEEYSRPEELTVYYTGEFVDTYPYECSLDMQRLFEVTDQATDISGQFYTIADFDFQTWGYATLSFMDRDVITALRQQGKNPAHELGIDQVVRAKYTPGPVNLGMLENQQLPIGIDTEDPDRTFLPAFGVTLGNEWRDRGEVTHIKKLVLQVPRPLSLDVDACAGYDGKPVIRTPSYGNDIPEGYLWYEFTDLTFDSEQQLRTVRCPLVVDSNDYGSLLGPDLSAREFTLVALADYSYRSMTLAPGNLRLERVS